MPPPAAVEPEPPAPEPPEPEIITIPANPLRPDNVDVERGDANATEDSPRHAHV